MVAVSAPDLISSGLNPTTTTTRGQVTLEVKFSVEIDSKYNWLDFRSAQATAEEWDQAEVIIAQIPQVWDDPDWGKIWNAVRSGLRIGANILQVIPHPVAQGIGRATNRVVDVLGG